MPDSNPNSAQQDVAAIAGNAVGDQPTLQDSLGFTPYVEAIAAFLTSPATPSPLTMSIEGEWGSGKSSFMLQLEQVIRKPSKTAVLMSHLPKALGGLSDHGSAWQALRLFWTQKQRITIEFNAWRHDKQDALWAAFALKFTKSLRKQIGVLRGWKGDLVLFLSRLKGLRGWLELLLLIVSVLLLLFGLVGLYRFVKIHDPAEVKQLLIEITHPEGKRSAESSGGGTANSREAPPNVQGSSQLSRHYDYLFSRGKWGISIALAIAGFIRFRKYLKLPLSFHLEKYLVKPDYRGRVAFIETFHEDFGRLVRAYAANKKIFIFIDDLDRCDVPRAAELMQALNLMIGDAGKLIFILGMDREKVAAGIAQKYKDLLPFLPEFAESNPTQSLPLYFGYAYLQKFIQLSFTLPVISDASALSRFLAQVESETRTVSWPKRLVAYWHLRAKTILLRFALFKNQTIDATAAKGNDASKSTAATAETAVTQQRRVEYLRIKVDKDSDRVRRIVMMVSALFENNPRKLKQFINTFRLALFLASNQGLLDRQEGCRFVTPEQLGKFAAITLRFPDLRSELAKDMDLLATMQRTVIQLPPNTEVPAPLKWLNQPGLRKVLHYGVELGAEPFNEEIYSLVAFPVDKLLSVLPNVPEPTPEPAPSPEVPKPVSTKSNSEAFFEQLGKQYENIRASQNAGPTRTRDMTLVFNEARDRAKKLAASTAINIFDYLRNLDTDGSRVIATAIAAAQRDPHYETWLLVSLDEYRSAFEHYVCIRALLDYLRVLSDEDCAFIVNSLDRHWADIQKDPGRLASAEDLREGAEKRRIRAENRKIKKRMGSGPSPPK
jgi:hypothetical protein